MATNEQIKSGYIPESDSLTIRSSEARIVPDLAETSGNITIHRTFSGSIGAVTIDNISTKLPSDLVEPLINDGRVLNPELDELKREHALIKRYHPGTIRDAERLLKQDLARLNRFTDLHQAMTVFFPMEPQPDDILFKTWAQSLDTESQDIVIDILANYGSRRKRRRT